MPAARAHMSASNMSTSNPPEFEVRDRRNGEQPLVSVVIAAHNAERDLPRTLAALDRSTFRDFELIVVDDASTDDTHSVIEAFGPAVHATGTVRRGPFACRNLGARHARGEILFFTDADVVVRPDTLDRLMARLAVGDADSLIGIYSLEHPNTNLCSIYKNSWIRHSYLGAAGRTRWFFTAVGAVRREDWLRTGAFDAVFQTRTGGGDVDYGRRLHENGVRILLDPDLEVIHLKAFTLWSLLHNDFCRAFGWTSLALQSDPSVTRAAGAGFANVNGRFVAGVAIAGILVGSLALAPLLPQALLPAAAAFLLGVAINARFLAYLARNASVGVAVASAPLMLLDQIACGFGIAAGLIRRPFAGRRRPSTAPTTLPTSVPARESASYAPAAASAASPPPTRER